MALSLKELILYFWSQPYIKVGFTILLILYTFTFNFFDLKGSTRTKGHNSYKTRVISSTLRIEYKKKFSALAKLYGLDVKNIRFSRSTFHKTIVCLNVTGKSQKNIIFLTQDIVKNFSYRMLPLRIITKTTPDPNQVTARIWLETKLY